MRSGDGDRLRAAYLTPVGEDVGEVDSNRLGVDGRDHLLAGDDFDELRAGLADLVVERVAVALLDDHFVARKAADIRHGDQPRFEIFGHHGGIPDDHGRRGSAGDKAGIAGR